MANSAQLVDQPPSKTGSAAPTIVEVDLGNRSYPIYIGSGLLDQPELLQRFQFLVFSLYIYILIQHNLYVSVGLANYALLLLSNKFEILLGVIGFRNRSSL